MKQQMFAKLFSAIVILVCLASPARAALITTNFSELVGNQGTVDIVLTNNSETAGIAEFSIYFSELLFSNLSIINSPQGWDSALSQPDIFSDWPGVFDSYTLDLPLALGASQAGFKLGFTYLGQGPLAPLNFDIIGDNWAVIASGTSINVTSHVTEPTPAVLILLGLAVVGFARRRQGWAAL